MSGRVRYERTALVAIVAATVALALSAPARHTLRVCADPNNLPFSNDRLEGFENRLAELVARDLNARLEYVWWAQRRGYLRNTIAAGKCDVWMGLPSQSRRTLVTRPYYRSSYVFVTRRDGPRVATLDDPVLRRVRVGVQLIGDDGQNSPPAHALAARRIVANVVGYPVYGDYGQPNPPARIVDAVARGDVDVAAVWGPVAGYFARTQPVALDLTIVTPLTEDERPFAFDIAIGVTRRLPAVRDAIDRIIEWRRSDIKWILDRYHVPRV
jgi:mxaJ protein